MPQLDQNAISIIILVVFIAFFYFFVIRPQRKKDKEIQKMRNSLKVGDKVITIGGIHGKISKLGEEFVTIEIGSGNLKSSIEISKWGIGTSNGDSEVKNN